MLPGADGPVLSRQVLKFPAPGYCDGISRAGPVRDEAEAAMSEFISLSVFGAPE
jgi:hypothetical protein